ncbi:MAG: phasin family protein [Beijerinckiaceae bacterium]|nr:phasin family protein [Beijerinckiaceae bacterium]
MAKRSKASAPATGNPADGEEFVEDDSAFEPAPQSEEAPDTSSAAPIGVSKAVEVSQSPAGIVFEAAIIPELEVLEKLGAEGLQAAETAASSFAGYYHQFANENFGYTKESLETGYAFASELRQSESLVNALKIHIDFSKSAYVRLLDHIVKVSGFYWSLLRAAPASGRSPAA